MSLVTAFAGKVYLVCSAGKGIGRALAVRLYKYGATVYAIANREEPLVNLKRECPNMITICLDLSDWEATRTALEDLEVMDGVINNSTLNKLINNTGTECFQPVLGITVEKFDEVFSQVVKPVLNVSQITANKMIAAGRAGSIVNIGTLVNKATIPNAATYRAAKSALDELSRSLAYEFGKDNIKVNSVSLGCVWTPAFERIMQATKGSSNIEFVTESIRSSTTIGSDPMVPMDDVINTVLFVLSNLASKMSGGNIVLDAGLSSAV